MRSYTYSTVRDRRKQPAWFDNQSKRWISRNTLVSRTGLSMSHVKLFENGRDGYGYVMTLKERRLVEDSKHVELY